MAGLPGRIFISITGLLEGDPVFHFDPQGAGSGLNTVGNEWGGQVLDQRIIAGGQL